MDQAKWDNRYLGLCEYIAKWSKDPSTKVGAVIVDPQDNSIVSLGYNGFPRQVLDTPDRLENRETKYRMIVHAERNAMLFARRDLRGMTLYTMPFMPCARCAGMIIQAGISRIVTVVPPLDIESRWGADLAIALKMITEAHVQLSYISRP